MTDLEITALVREFAEEEYKTLNLPTDHTEVSAYRYMDFARFLLRRFYLVEKEAVRKEYDLAEKLWIKSACAITEEFNMGRMNAIESLFPEIAKEVE